MTRHANFNNLNTKNNKNVKWLKNKSRYLLLLRILKDIEFLYIYFSFCRICNNDSISDSGNQVEMLMWLTDPCRYDRLTRPIPSDGNDKTGGPTRVYTRIYVYFLGSVEAQQLVSH